MWKKRIDHEPTLTNTNNDRIRVKVRVVRGKIQTYYPGAPRVNRGISIIDEKKT
jgi:hypothetical protein